MLPRLCKLCYHSMDESIVKLRRFSVKHVETLTEEFDDGIYGHYIDRSVEEPLPKPTEKKCIIKCKRSKFNFYEGQVYPKFEPIPLASRGWQHRDSYGDYFTIYPYENIPEETIDKSVTFRDINLNEVLLQNLEDNNIIHPTLIQKLAIPRILNSENVVISAETGCGKTFAFLLPLLQQIIKWKSLTQRGCNKPLGLIVTPSKELTQQISKVAKNISKNLNVKFVTLCGGRTKKIMLNPPVGEVDIIVCTLGVISKLVTIGIYQMDEIRHVIIDEADTLFDGTFTNKLCNLLRKIPIGANRDPNILYPETAQLTLNSATIPDNIDEILENVVNPNSLVAIKTGFEHHINVPQKFMRLTGSQKPMALLKIVKPKVKQKIPILIFSNSFKTCDFTSIFLKQFNIKTINLHGGMPVHVRKGKFNEFQNGICNVLTTTDAGARGLDTTIVKYVVNYDFPLITAEYIHRCGRIGRIGSPKDCAVTNFISNTKEIILARKIEFASRKLKPIPIVDMLNDNENCSELASTNEDIDKDQPLNDFLDLDDKNNNIQNM